MKPLEFLEPQSLREACALLSKYGEKAKILAGGQSLRPLLKQGFLAPEYLIDLKGVPELSYITEDRDCLKIGAMTTERSIETSPLVKKRFPILVEMEGFLSSLQVRNWGTIGGSLCFSDPSGNPAVALIALDARVKLVSTNGSRELPVEEFETGYLENVLQPDEILTEIIVPYLPPHSAGAFVEEVVRAGDLGIAIVAATVSLDDRKQVKQARIVIGAQSVSPSRATEAEALAVGRKASDKLDDIGRAAAEVARPQTDVLGSVEYKRELVKLLTRQALGRAIERAA